MSFLFSPVVISFQMPIGAVLALLSLQMDDVDPLKIVVFTCVASMISKRFGLWSVANPFGCDWFFQSMIAWADNVLCQPLPDAVRLRSDCVCSKAEVLTRHFVICLPSINS